MNEDIAIGIAIEEFLLVHRQCWRAHGRGLRAGAWGTLLWLECPECWSAVLFPLPHLKTDLFVDTYIPQQNSCVYMVALL